MNDVGIYHLVLDGQVEETAVNANSPQAIQVETSEPESTRLKICTDQAGLIGVLRHLHGHGFLLLFLEREPAAVSTRN